MDLYEQNKKCSAPMSLQQTPTNNLIYLYSVVTLRIQNVALFINQKFFLNSSLLFMCVRLKILEWGHKVLSKLHSLKTLGLQN